MHSLINMINMIALITLMGCGGVARVSPSAPQGDTFATSWTAARCQVLLDQRDAATWGAALGGGLSGAGGLATAFPDDDDWQLGLGISTAVVAAVATSLTILAKMKSDEFESYCNVAASMDNGSDKPTVSTLEAREDRPADKPAEIPSVPYDVDAGP